MYRTPSLFLAVALALGATAGLQAANRLALPTLVKAQPGVAARQLSPVLREQSRFVSKLDNASVRELQTLALANGQLYGTLRGKMCVVSGAGKLEGLFDLPIQNVSGLAAYRKGLLLAGDAAGRALYSIDPGAKMCTKLFGLNELNFQGVENGELLALGQLSGVASDGANRVFVATQAGYSSSVFEIDPTSRRVVRQAYAPGPTPGAMQFVGGNLLLLDEQSTLLRRFDGSLKLSLDAVHVVGKLGEEVGRGLVVEGDQVRLLSPKVHGIATLTAPLSKLVLAPVLAPVFRISPEAVQAIAEALAAPRKYAVLITGDRAESGYDEFWNDTVWLYKVLRANGYSKQNVHVLYGDGADYASPNPRYRYGETVTDFPANSTWVNKVLDGMKNGDAANGIAKLRPQDTLFVWTFDHGGRYNGQSTLGLRDGGMLASSLSARLNAVPCASREVFMQQCFSGGFVPLLQNTKTFVSTASSATEVAHRADAEKESFGGAWYHHGEYNYWIISSLGKATATGAPLNADTNGNGKISGREAHAYDVGHENQPEVPQMSDLGGVGLAFHLN